MHGFLLPGTVLCLGFLEAVLETYLRVLRRAREKRVLDSGQSIFASQRDRMKKRAGSFLKAVPYLLIPPLLQGATPAFAEGADADGSSVSSSVPHAPGEQPRLVVVLVVDQLRGDMLSRYYRAFSGGLKRLMDEGLSFPNALHAHAVTETAPGHATISTGVYPGRAGIPSNAWRERVGGELRRVYHVVDPKEGLLGVPGLAGASPKVLLRTGLADWIREADPEATVISVSGKDRAAVLMAGQSKGDVFWFHSQTGRFVTSTYYRDDVPSWLSEFNRTVMRRYRSDSVWVSTVPKEVAHLSAPDTAAFEYDGVHTSFPHRYYDERIDPTRDDFFYWFELTPMLDDATLSLARVAMLETGAGSREGVTDYLSVALSQTDRVGHEFGPLGREQMDNLLRLDGALGEFLEFLDETVGPQHYLLGLTSDHGIMTMPERMETPGARLTTQQRRSLEWALGSASRAAARGGESSPARFMIEEMREMPFVGPAYTHPDLQDGEASDSTEALFQHSFMPGRYGGLLSPFGVEMWWAENTVGWNFPLGTTHGSPYHYDRWVPMILVGEGIDAGVDERPVRPMDLAPTLARLAGIPFPEDLDGRPLLEGKD
jgi:predicted AlkP superfamily pyrophosphatase or phosphodiesterase